MLFVRSLTNRDQPFYDQVVNHPLQSWAWGDFKYQQGSKVERLGFFENDRLISGLQVIFSHLPGTNYMIGYVPKGCMPDEAQLNALNTLAQKHHAIYIKLEPNVARPVDQSHNSAFDQIEKFLAQKGAVRGKALFTKYDFWLNLSPTQEELFANLSSKTRYNVRLAIKKGVQIIENTSPEGIEVYLRLMAETTKRQGFYNHNPEYFRRLLSSFSEGQVRIFQAMYQGEALTAWIMFNFNGQLYYPYGASSNIHREVMPNNLMMWEMIRFGKNQGCTNFDMWGSLGPNPDKNDPWYGFHRFKAGYNPTLVEYIGTFDLVYNPKLYQAFNFADKWRWRFLKAKSRFFSSKK